MRDYAHDGLYGLLIGDALGVPYEFRPVREIPPEIQIEFIPPKGYDATYPNVPPGTWSDDGAQALCLLDSLLSCGKLDIYDLGLKLLEWVDHGLWAVDGVVFDCGIQTMRALRAFANGTPPEKSGYCIPDGKGNGSLMRVLPLALWHRGSVNELVLDAHRQSVVTHGHICNQVCCALYCVWARRLMCGERIRDAYENAAALLKEIYSEQPEYLYELEICIADGVPSGTGYVVDSIRSARHLLFEHDNYESVVKGAVLLGNDTDTTAAIAGGLAGIAYGNLPGKWLSSLRSKNIVDSLLVKLTE